MKYCFYHSADLDGHCSGAIVKYKHPDCTLYPINYGDKFPWDRIEKNDTVYMIDFSLQPIDEMNKLCDLLGFNLIWIDHHETAAQEYYRTEYKREKNCLYVYDYYRAACELTYSTMFPMEKDVPYFIKCLGRYDIWDHGFSEDVLPLQYGLRSYETNPLKNMDIWLQLLEGMSISDYIQEGKTILKYIDREYKEYCDAMSFYMEWENYRVLACNRLLTGSKLFNSKWNKSKYDIMMVFGWKGGKWSISLYTDKEDVNVGLIAYKYGGGGHRQAAGFQCGELPFKLEK